MAARAFGRQTDVVAPSITGPAGYQEWTVPAPLHRFLACSWTGGVDPRARSTEPVLPDGCMDIIWDGSRLFVAGPDTMAQRVATGGPVVVGLRFLPGVGPQFLRVPAHALRDQRVDLGLLWPDAGQECEGLARTTTVRRAAGHLEQMVVRRLPDIEAPDPIVEAAVRLWRRGGPTSRPIVGG